MRPPFPGMDPWLEHPGLWPDVHNRLIAAIADALAAQLIPRYYVGVEGRMVLYPGTDDQQQRRPDVGIRPGDLSAPMAGGVAVAVEVEVEAGVDLIEVDLPVEEGFEVNETYLEIREAETHDLVTTLEVLSPANKAKGRGREQYLAKRDEVIRSATNLVEVDLLRGGEPMPMLGPSRRSAYRVLVSRGRDRPRAALVAIDLRVALPTILIPLLPGDRDARLELNRVLHELIERAFYYYRVDYAADPVPPLGEADLEWARQIIARAG